jgi:DNA-binding CsgD family transcriptional regulator
VEICEQGRWDDSMVTQFVFWADVLVEQARGHEAEQALDRITRKRFEETTLEWPQFLHTRARSRWLHGDREAALDFFLQCGKSLDGTGIVNPVFLPWRTDAACLLAELGRRSEAAVLVEQNREPAYRWGTARSIGLHLMAEGAASDGARAVESLTEAVEVLAGSPARLEEARARYRLGAALLRVDDTRGARKHLRGALDLAALCGSRALVESARELAVAAGSRVGQTAESPVDLLTGSEHRVATMAASGASNREIAEALFVTLRTVETHLTNAYRKLRVSSRENLSAALAEFQSSVGHHEYVG